MAELRNVAPSNAADIDPAAHARPGRVPSPHAATTTPHIASAEGVAPLAPGAGTPSDPLRSTVDDDGPEGRISKPPNAPWMFIWHPGNWSVAHVTEDSIPEGSDLEPGTYIVPRLTSHPLIPGVLGFRTRKRGESVAQQMSHVMERLERNGAIVLPTSWGYQQSYPCIDPRTKGTGLFYTDIWSTPRARPPRPGVAIKLDFDRAGFVRWLLSLQLAGVFPEPEAHEVEALAERRQVRLQRVKSDGGWARAPEAKAKRLAELQADLEAVQKARVAYPAEEG